MEEHAAWFIDTQRLAHDLSVAAGPDPTTWDWDQMRKLAEMVFASPTPEIGHYLTLIRLAPDDQESTQVVLRDFRQDLPRWFEVVMAPSLSKAGSISGHPSLVIPMLEGCGWERADATALLLGDPLATLARKIGLDLVASQLTAARITGWLSLDRVASLDKQFRAISMNPAEALKVVVRTTGAYWPPTKAEAVALRIINEATAILTRTVNRRLPLCVKFDA